MSIIIDPIEDIEDCRLVERLQQQIWQSKPVEIVPDHLLLTIAKEGGIVFIARNEKQEPLGFALSFLSKTESGQLKLASHMVGVLPQQQNRNVGYQIKLAQRQIAQQHGLALITWTYDPLLSRNARLNLHKLGAICNRYQRNLYGSMRNELNEGLPTDRFQVAWWINSEHVAQRLAGHYPLAEAELPILNPVSQQVDGLPHPAESVLPLADQPLILIETPADFLRLKTEAISVAQAWQQQLRVLFENCFRAGYTAIDLIRRDERTYYLLQKGWSPGRGPS